MLPFVAQCAGNDLLDKWGLTDSGWRLTITKRLHYRYGQCCYRDLTLDISEDFIRANDFSRVRNCILHEIAHALTGSGHGHNDFWKQKCILVGAEPSRLDCESVAPMGRLVAICSGCGRKHSRNRLPKRPRVCLCRKGTALVWYERDKLVISR